MFSSTDLIELHHRAHRGTLALLEHCTSLTAEEVQRELPGFGYPSVALQIHHILEAEEYWMLVLRGEFREEMDAFMDAAACSTVEAMLVYRDMLESKTAADLATLDEAFLNTPHEFLTWPNSRRELHPAMIVMRVITHHFHHRGQIMAMCRILGKPCVSADFPVVP